MADRHPTDEFCKPHEYIVERNGTWFIVDVYNRLRIHPEEYPEELRNRSDAPPYSPPSPGHWYDTLLAGATVLASFVLLPIMIPFLLVVGAWAEMHPDPMPAQRKAWEAATYRDAGIHQPILHTWDGTGGMSAGISSPDPTWGV